MYINTIDTIYSKYVVIIYHIFFHHFKCFTLQ